MFFAPGHQEGRFIEVPPSIIVSNLTPNGDGVMSGNHSHDLAPARVRIGPPAGVRTPNDDFHSEVE